MVKKLPVGLSDFQKLIEGNYYYVDKSLFIKDIIDSGSETVLLPRPRRFGKTLNLSMLRYFYEKTDEDNSQLFQHLAIWQQGNEYIEKQGKHPVIYLTFKDVKCRTWEECNEHLNIVIGEEYKRHKYLLNEKWMDPQDEEQYLTITGLSASKAIYQNSLKKLSAYLHKYYGKKAVILIDEYDTPIQGGYINGYYQDVIDFMRNLLSGALKDNSSLEKGVLTGILRIAKESIFSGLNNLQVCSLLKDDYSHYFGLTTSEVEEILQYHRVAFDTEEVKNWYNGYVFGDTTIYNPWSIINFTDKWRDGLLPYWVNTSSNDLVKQIITRSGPKVKEELESLIRGQSIQKAVDDNIVFGEIENSSDTIWSFLLFSGYVKATSKYFKNKRLHCDLKIPNLEVEYLYEEIILSWFQQSVYSDKYDMMLKGLVAGDVETFEYIFQEIVLKTFSYFDTSGQEPEKVYHAFALGLFLHLKDTYDVRSNRESGFGRYDVMLTPRNTANKGIIIEFKTVNKAKKETLEKAAEAALRQIEEKKYEQELKEYGVEDILKLGIAFQGKEVFVKHGA